MATESTPAGTTEGARDTYRLEAFSDGVIAIAITLLIIEIHVPEGAASAAEMWEALRGLWPNYLGYAISFATIGIMWANHHAIFRLISRTDHYLILTNLFFLLCLAFIPFPTAVMTETLGHANERVGIVAYSGWFLVTALAYNVLWRYASSRAAALMPGVNPRAIQSITTRFRLGPPAYAVAFALSFVSTWASLGLLLLLALAYVLPYAAPEG
ncbi:MAG: DUF1211 domain-containing protein [Chloroflexia bacterium]|nr:DUF1211 domain-containing protein [Chloroflexia bacterium]